MAIGYIYITICPKHRVYIGQHQKEEYDGKYLGSGKVLKNIIAKYGKESVNNRVLEWCEDIESLNEREKWWIGYFRKSKLKCINIDKGGKGAEAATRQKLRRKHKEIANTQEHKDIFTKHCLANNFRNNTDDTYYEQTAVRRQDFKRRCNTYDLKFEDYVEVHVATKVHGKRLKFYKYYRKGKDCLQNNINADDMILLERYSTVPTPRSTFKRSCKTRGWNFEDYEEIFVEWYYFTNDPSHRARRFLYKKRIEE